MLSDIFTMLLGLVPQSEKVDGLLRKIRASSDRDELLELLCSAIPLIGEADDTHVFKLFVEKVSAINNDEEERAYLDVLALFLLRYEAYIPPLVRVLVTCAVALWRKAINKYSVSSRNSSLPPSLDKIRRSLNKESSEQTEGPKSRLNQGSDTPSEHMENPENKDSPSAGSSSVQPEEEIQSEDSKKKPGGQTGHRGYSKRCKRAHAVVVMDRSPVDMVDCRPIAPLYFMVEDVYLQSRVTGVLINRWRDKDRNIIEAVPSPELPEKRENLRSFNVYGRRFKAQVVSLLERNFLSYSRVAELARDYYGISVSVGSIRNFVKEAADKLRVLGFEENLKSYLLHIPRVLNSDETGINVSGKTFWAHIVCTNEATYVYPNPTRGIEAILDGGILNNVRKETVIVHDCWASYFSVAECGHSLCGAHIVRELLRAYSREYLPWALSMLRLLIKANEYKEATGPISGDEYRTLAENYDRILAEGLAQLEKHNIIYGHQASDSGKLIKRLKKRRDEYLLFARDSEVPFTNNLAERGFRGLKNKMKIGGCFRSFASAEDFLLVWSYLETCRKHNMMSIQALEMAFDSTLPTLEIFEK